MAKGKSVTPGVISAKEFERWGDMSEHIRCAWNPQRTVYEVAKIAGVQDIEMVRRILCYHKLKCVSMRERIDILNAQLEGQLGVRIVPPIKHSNRRG